jgi:hypothetical protein
VHCIIDDNLSGCCAGRQSQAAGLGIWGEGADGFGVGGRFDSVENLESLKVMDVGLALKNDNQPAESVR